MNKEKIIGSLDWLAILSMKVYIMFQVLNMLLMAISIRHFGYRLLLVLLDCTTIAIAVHFLKRMKSDSGNPENYFTKKVLIGEAEIVLKIYIKVVLYTIIVLLLLSQITTYN